MEDIKLFGMKLIDTGDFSDLLFRFGLDFFFLFIIIRFIYVPINRNREYLFTFYIFNIVIFFLCALLSSVKLKLGFAFGLFAVLSILRYRTEAIPIKEMTFLFLSITIAVINALVNKKVSITEILFTNSVILGVTYYLEKKWLQNHYSYQMVTYERIELITPEKRPELIKDLQDRTGLVVVDIEIIKINLLSDSAQLKVYYHE